MKLLDFGLAHSPGITVEASIAVAPPACAWHRNELAEKPLMHAADSSGSAAYFS